MGTWNCHTWKIPKASCGRSRGKGPKNRCRCCVRGYFLERLSRFSDWNTMLNTIARIKGLVSRDRSMFISVEEREKAALVLIKAAQREAFEEELKCLSQNPAKLSKNNRLYLLDPILQNELLRVGGRLRKSNAALELKHPINLPKALSHS